MKKGIAFFDFDGTITKKDTLLEFIKFAKGDFKFYWGFLIKSPYLIGYKLKLVTNQVAKEKILQYFFKGTPINDFNKYCEKFSTAKIPKLLRKDALKEIKKLQFDGNVVVIVSASPENWIKPWAEIINVELIGTVLQIEDNMITGKINGYNCYGNEKVIRIRDIYNLNEYTKIFAYGDTKGDLPMLALADYFVYKPFR